MRPDAILFIGGGLGPRNQWDIYFFILKKREAGNVRMDVGRWVTYGRKKRQVFDVIDFSLKYTSKPSSGEGCQAEMII